MKSLRLIIILFSFLLSVFSQNEIKFETRTRTKNWDDAKEACVLSGGQLFMPDNQEIWDKFNEFHVNQFDGKYYWIGIFYENSKTAKFLDNRVVNISFATILPNTGSSFRKQCGVLFTEGKLRYIRNADCERISDYICEFGRAPATATESDTTTTAPFTTKFFKRKPQFDLKTRMLILGGLVVLLAVLSLACYRSKKSAGLPKNAPPTVAKPADYYSEDPYAQKPGDDYSGDYAADRGVYYSGTN